MNFIIQTIYLKKYWLPMSIHRFEASFLNIAFEEARLAYEFDEVPVGCVIVKDNKIVGRGHNQVIKKTSVCAHAEILAINNASQVLQNYRLVNCDIYVTLEPCHMCAKAIIDARIKNLFFSTPEPKTGAVISIDNFLDKKHHNHKVSYSYGYSEDLSSSLLKKFFLSKREKLHLN